MLRFTDLVTQPARTPRSTASKAGNTVTVRTLHPVSSEQRRADRTTELLTLLPTLEGAARDQAIGEVVELNMPVADRIAARFGRRGIPVEDLQQVAYLALTRCTQRFDPERPATEFLAYAVPSMRGEVRKYFRDHGWMVRPTRRVQEVQSRAFNAVEPLTAQLGRAPRPAEIAAHLDEPVEVVTEAMGADGCFTPVSLDLPVGFEGATDPLGELLRSPDDEMLDAEARAALIPLLRRLGERDRLIVALRFYEDLSQREIAEHVGLSQMQVSRLLHRILDELREALTGPFQPVSA
jgi:RNA polymerase sigma-B factor